jgi:hypothetical protein
MQNENGVEVDGFETSWTGVDADGDTGGASNNNSEEFLGSDGMNYLNEEGLFDNEGHLNQHLMQNSVSQEGDLFENSFAIPPSVNDDDINSFYRQDATNLPINVVNSQHTTITMSSQRSVSIYYYHSFILTY